jgi:hypothetical protein
MRAATVDQHHFATKLREKISEYYQVPYAFVTV